MTLSEQTMTNGVIAMLQRIPRDDWDEVLTKVTLTAAQRSTIDAWVSARGDHPDDRMARQASVRLADLEVRRAQRRRPASPAPASDEQGDSAMEKVRENKVRRAAARQGLKLMKSRVRDPRAVDFGCFAITDVESGVIVAGLVAGQFGFTLDDVEAYVYGDVQPGSAS